MLKSNNFQHYKLSTLSFLNIKIPSFSFLKKAILGLYKNLFWHISRKIGKILENFQKVPFKALVKQQKIFSKSLMKMDRFPKKIFLLKNQIVTISGVFCHMWWVSVNAPTSRHFDILSQARERQQNKALGLLKSPP